VDIERKKMEGIKRIGEGQPPAEGGQTDLDQVPGEGGQIDLEASQTAGKGGQITPSPADQEIDDDVAIKEGSPW